MATCFNETQGDALNSGRYIEDNSQRSKGDIDYCYVSRLKRDDAAGVDDVHTHPAEPRALRVTLNASF